MRYQHARGLTSDDFLSLSLSQRAQAPLTLHARSDAGRGPFVTSLESVYLVRRSYNGVPRIQNRDVSYGQEPVVGCGCVRARERTTLPRASTPVRRQPSEWRAFTQSVGFERERCSCRVAPSRDDDRRVNTYCHCIFFFRFREASILKTLLLDTYRNITRIITYSNTMTSKVAKKKYFIKKNFPNKNQKWSKFIEKKKKTVN